MSQLNIKILSANDASPEFVELQARINNPNGYKGEIVYIREVGATLYPPFDQTKKFYFNENGAWFVSPFEVL